MNTRHGRKTDIHHAAISSHLYAAVLGDASLCDIQIGHDLESGDDSRVHLGFGRHEFIHHTVYSYPHAKLVQVRFEMDIAYTVADGFQKDPVRQINDRASFRHFCDFFDFPLSGVGHNVDGGFVNLSHKIVHGHFFIVVATDGLLDVISAA